MTEVDLGPGIRAFFTTREGGASIGSYATLNVGDAVGDQPLAVLRNRDLLAQEAGVPIHYLRQVHGRDVVDVTFVNACESRGFDAALSADGATSVDPRLALCVYVADCVPILLADPVARVIGTAHAGRQGLERGIIAATVARMAARGASPAHMRVAVGPCICGSCYEVPNEMAVRFAQLTGSSVTNTRWNSTGISLRAATCLQFEQLGITHVTHIEQCTYESLSYFSHRRATHLAGESAGFSGRFAGIVRLLD